VPAPPDDAPVWVPTGDATDDEPLDGAAPEMPAARLEAPSLVPVARRVVYFDLETQRSAAEVGGWQNTHRMRLALGVVYDERDERFTVYREADAEALIGDLRGADLVVGYNVLRFDYPVLSAYADGPLVSIATFDMLPALRARLRQRLPLANLAGATLGAGKSADGLQSLAWVREGRLDLVEAYCRHDVELTRDLFRYALRHGHVYFELEGRRYRSPDLEWDLERIAQDAARRRAARVRGLQPTLFPAPPPRPTW
jgi:DEAD/DEAH box helicase domain-containing protein